MDASSISAPSSTKNYQKEWDPEMHRVNGDNQWYLGMKAHLRTNSWTHRIPVVTFTVENVLALIS
ncbi:MAG: hypothetical protein U0236_12280 [Nitrospira sp.]